MITVRQRTDTKEPAWQVDIKAMPLGALRAQRYTAPHSITSKSAALRWGEQVRREIEAGKPPPQSREGKTKAVEEKVEREEAAPSTAARGHRHEHAHVRPPPPDGTPLGEIPAPATDTIDGAIDGRPWGSGGRPSDVAVGHACGLQ